MKVTITGAPKTSFKKITNWLTDNAAKAKHDGNGVVTDLGKTKIKAFRTFLDELFKTSKKVVGIDVADEPKATKGTPAPAPASEPVETKTKRTRKTKASDVEAAEPAKVVEKTGTLITDEIMQRFAKSSGQSMATIRGRVTSCGAKTVEEFLQRGSYPSYLRGRIEALIAK